MDGKNVFIYFNERVLGELDEKIAAMHSYCISVKLMSQQRETVSLAHQLTHFMPFDFCLKTKYKNDTFWFYRRLHTGLGISSVARVVTLLYGLNNKATMLYVVNFRGAFGLILLSLDRPGLAVSHYFQS